MPVDRRLREGLHADADALPVATDPALDRALARGRRGRVRRRAGAVVLAGLIVAVVAVAASALRAGPAPTPATGSTLQGTWRTAPRSAGQILAAVTARGGDPACAELPAAAEIVWVLTIDDQRFTVQAQVDGWAPVEDRAGFVERLADGRIRLIEPDGPSTSTFITSLDGDRLLLQLDDVEAGGEDRPCEVLAEAIAQLSAPFARA